MGAKRSFFGISLSRRFAIRTAVSIATCVTACGVGLLLTEGTAVAVTCTIRWDVNAPNSSWDDATNWVDVGTHAHRLPNANDDVCIKVSGANVVHTIGTVTVRSVQVTTGAALTVTSGSLDVTGPAASSISSLTLNSGHWDGSGATTITGQFAANEAGLGGGTVTVGSGATASVSNRLHVSDTVIDNKGTWALVGAGAVTQGSGTMVFHNEGTLTHDTGLSSIEIPFDNDGVVKVNGGELNPADGDNGATTDGTYNVLSGATLNFHGSPWTFSAAAKLIGAGTLKFTNAGATLAVGVTYQFPIIDATTSSLVLDKSFNLPDVSAVSGSTITGAGSLTVTHSFTVDNSELNRNGPTTVASGATFAVTNGDFDGGTFTIASGAAGSFAGASCHLTAAAIVENKGTLALVGDGGITQGSAGTNIHNTGTITHDSGVWSINQPVTNDGVVKVNGGELHFDEAEVNDGKYTVSNSKLSGASFTNHGTVNFDSNGSASFSQYSQTAASTLKVHVAGTTPGAGFSQLATTGAVTLDGTVAITTDPPFSPSPGDSFAIVTAGTRSGQFATVDGTDIGANKLYAPQYSATGVALTVVHRTITASVADATVSEGDSGTSNLGVLVTLDQPSQLPVSVHVKTIDGNATAPDDYAAVQQAVNFPVGVTERTVNISVVGEHVEEADETFTVKLSNPTEAVIGRAQAKATILDDDGPRSFLSYRLATPNTSDWNIFASNRFGGNATQLTSTTTQELSARWAPDGTQISFGAIDAAHGSTHSTWVMNADGTNAHQLSFPTSSDAAWSPDSQHIVSSHLDGNGGLHLYTMNADGSNPQRITTGTAKDSVGDWSTDGSTIAFTRVKQPASADIWLVDSNGSNPRRLTFNGASMFPRISPDSSRVVFQGGFGQVFVVGTDGSGLQKLTAFNTTKRRAVEPVWSPSGDEIAFTVQDLDGVNVTAEDIFVMNADGGNLHQVTFDGVEKGLTSWRPCSIFGTTGDDQITGTSGDDVICGLDGTDTIDGEGGNDVIEGGAGNDTLNAGSGENEVYGGAGTDSCSGAVGDSFVLCESVSSSTPVAPAAAFTASDESVAAVLPERP